MGRIGSQQEGKTMNSVSQSALSWLGTVGIIALSVAAIAILFLFSNDAAVALMAALVINAAGLVGVILCGFWLLGNAIVYQLMDQPPTE